MLLAVDFFRAVHNDFLNQLVDRNRIQFLQVRILFCKLEKAATSATCSVPLLISCSSAAKSC